MKWKFIISIHLIGQWNEWMTNTFKVSSCFGNHPFMYMYMHDQMNEWLTSLRIHWVSHCDTMLYPWSPIFYSTQSLHYSLSYVLHPKTLYFWSHRLWLTSKEESKIYLFLHAIHSNVMFDPWTRVYWCDDFNTRQGCLMMRWICMYETCNGGVPVGQMCVGVATNWLIAWVMKTYRFEIVMLWIVACNTCEETYSMKYVYMEGDSQTWHVFCTILTSWSSASVGDNEN